ncbi:O-methyltransferase family protein [Talaromyces stipitatus ATCC 10500]|uniref:O-methyltransferase family protein n=1 Tax=Talaromyces stipitatus (strain ATCC 10500 / CBS 375.48 / QM 6759 / NRRL 1006) TaxID=441959 RepID=B8MBB3_TALSN|nr:O-methyltransferase family protein [Talaromyces stipitatus ATCC 10500]EED18902.1 O-methyltransferase family protein [Talaromyces stipitatus ATCC 10500]
MENLNQLQIYSTELATAIVSLSSHSQNGDLQQGPSSQPVSNSEGAHRAREKISSIVTKIRTLLWSPTDFLQHLACQNQILSCLKWLGENQILACIPLAEIVPIKDIADLTGVSATQLNRIIRLTATAGFLAEPKAAHVAHTPLSASFFSNPSLLDTAMLLSEFVAPATLQIGQQAPQQGSELQQQQQPSIYDSILSSAHSFHVARECRPKLNRQWSAYLHQVGGLYTATDVAAILTQLNWAKISNVPDACIFEVNVESLSSSVAQSLAEIYPNLHFNVQVLDRDSNIAPERESENFNPRLTVTNRRRGERQTANEAVVYILHLPLRSPNNVRNELMGHIDALRIHGSILLILTARLLPEPGTLSDPHVEAVARSRDLVLLQLANESEMELGELLEVIGTVKDSMGKLVVTKKLSARNGLVVSLVVKYEASQPMYEL